MMNITLISWFRALSDEQKRNLKKYNPVLFDQLNTESLKLMSFRDWRYEKAKQQSTVKLKGFNKLDGEYNISSQPPKRGQSFDDISNIFLADGSNTGDNLTHSYSDISDCCDCGCDF